MNLLKTCLLLFAFFLTGLLVSPVCLWADVYSWTDENGVKYFSNRPPVGEHQDLKVVKEFKYNPSADEQNWTAIEQEWEELIRQIETEERQQKARLPKKKKTRKVKKTEKEVRQEMIEKERQRLEQIIADLEAAPLSDFGSQRNKRMRLSVYKYKLEDLNNSPEKYFGWED
jgi:hypothetical protein